MDLSPSQIVKHLDKYIIGQDEAKKAVAIALRNRIRRLKIPNEQLQKEIIPANILMIGPTGVGKTEIARRLADIADAPFIKVEATKYTEVGYVGRDIESIIKDLLETAINKLKFQNYEKDKILIEKKVLDNIVQLLWEQHNTFFIEKNIKKEDLYNDVKNGKYDDWLITLHDSESRPSFRENIVDVVAIPAAGSEDVLENIQEMLDNLLPQRRQNKTVKVKKAFKILRDKYLNKKQSKDDIIEQAIKEVEEKGIVFIDELDKLASDSEIKNDNVSKQGVQEDILPLLEGTLVRTKYGFVKTDHILFIGAGAFQTAKPTDLIPEILGRFPIQVYLNPLTQKDFEKILTKAKNSVLNHYIELLKVENVEVRLTESAVKKVAEVAYLMNTTMENIGARRLHTVVAKLFEPELYEKVSLTNKEEIVIDKREVEKRLGNMIKKEKLENYIL